MTKRCSGCKETKPVSHFGVDRGRSSGLNPQCADCARERTRRKLEAQRSYLRAQKDRPCMDCGGRFHFAAMQFDHRPGTEKLLTIGDGRCVSQARLEAEVAKCDVICANCHQVRTWSRGRSGNGGGAPRRLP